MVPLKTHCLGSWFSTSGTIIMLIILWRSQPWSPCTGAAMDPGRVGASDTTTERVLGLGVMLCVSCVLRVK